MSLSATWDQMEQQLPEGRDGRMVRRVYSDSAIDLFAWAQRREPRRALELQVPVEDADLDLPVGTRGIVMTRSLVDTNHRVSALTLELTDFTAKEIFGVICTDIAGVVARCTDTKTASATWIGRYNRWRRLLATSPQGLTPQRQRGLYAELWVLREVFAKVLGVEAAVGAWLGPDRAARDFERLGRAVEVKSSATNEPQVVTVNGERQLDDAELRSLHLVHLSLEILPGAGETLPVMVASVEALASGGAAEVALEDALLAAGYANHHADQYERVGYALRRISVMTVDDGFPRITEADLDDGVGSVRYKLAIDACRQHETDMATLETFVGEADGQ